MIDLLGRIDAAIDGLCPCGAERRGGSAYCCDDHTLAAAFLRVSDGVAEGLAAALAPFERALAEAAASVHTNAPSATDEHPMLHAIELRRNRNTGPQPNRRTPRQINPRRGR